VIPPFSKLPELYEAGYEQDRYAKAVGERRIFRDIINTAYDPFELSKSKNHSVHYSNKNLIDPIKHDLEKVLEPSSDSLLY
jgi:hypothetical protein